MAFEINLKLIECAQNIEQNKETKTEYLENNKTNFILCSIV